MASRPDQLALHSFIELATDATTKDALYSLLRQYCAGLGAELVSYHRTMEGLRQTPFDEGFEFHSFPDAWVARYAARNYYSLDPIMLAARSANRPFRWFEVGQRLRLTSDQLAMLDDVRAHGIRDGIGVPVFSARGTAGYFGVGTCRGVLRLSEVSVWEVSLACQVTHARALELEPEPEPDAATGGALSVREVEILTRVARGESNGSIAAALHVSERTVDGALRRIYAKLDVSDRVSATVRALASGVIRL